MAVRKASAIWQGNLKEGNGRLNVESGSLDAPYSFGSRFEEGTGTNPEELIGAAHAGCFSMALSGILSEAGHKPEKIETSAGVRLDKTEGGFTISEIELTVRATIPDIDDETFRKHADEAKRNCPVSRALTGVKISLKAELQARDK